MSPIFSTQARLYELEGACEGREGERAAMESRHREDCRKLEASEAELGSARSELAAVRSQLSTARRELASSGGVVSREARLLRMEAEHCSSELNSVRAEAVEVSGVL